MLVIYFISIPKILMVGFPNDMVYQYNGPFIFDNTDVVGNKKINELIDFNNYDLLIFSINIDNLYKYGYNEKLKSFSGKIVYIHQSGNSSDKLEFVSISPKSKVYIYDHYLNLTDLFNIISDSVIS